MSRAAQSPSPLLESENGDNETPGAQAQTRQERFLSKQGAKPCRSKAAPKDRRRKIPAARGLRPATVRPGYVSRYSHQFPVAAPDQFGPHVCPAACARKQFFSICCDFLIQRFGYECSQGFSGMDRSLDRHELRNRAGAWAPTAQDQLSLEGRVRPYRSSGRRLRRSRKRRNAQHRIDLDDARRCAAFG
jgi:hypothetical protein